MASIFTNSGQVKKRQIPWNKGIKTGLIPKSAFKKGEHPHSETEIKKGQHLSKATEFKIGQNLKENNPDWKGEKASYSALHYWIKDRLIKPQTCRDCNYSKKLELANISGQYKRDISDWEWLCHKCNTGKDAKGRKEKRRPRARELFEKTTNGGLGRRRL